MIQIALHFHVHLLKLEVIYIPQRFVLLRLYRFPLPPYTHTLPHQMQIYPHRIMDPTQAMTGYFLPKLCNLPDQEVLKVDHMLVRQINWFIQISSGGGECCFSCTLYTKSRVQHYTSLQSSFMSQSMYCFTSFIKD